MTTPYAGNNVTGSTGLIAVDKVGNHIRFYDPETLREIKTLAVPEPAAHELAISHDRQLAFVPLYGDGIYGSNKKPNNKILVIDLMPRPSSISSHSARCGRRTAWWRPRTASCGWWPTSPTSCW